LEMAPFDRSLTTNYSLVKRLAAYTHLSSTISEI